MHLRAANVFTGCKSPTLAILIFCLGLSSLIGSDAETVRRVVQDAKELDDVPFSEVVLAVSGCKVIPVTPSTDQAWLAKLSGQLTAALKSLNEPGHPVQAGGRINEASRFIENELLARLNAVPGWKCGIPKTASSTEQRSGYPDLRLQLEDGRIVYLDPKLHAADNRASSFRTFYFEPKSETLKITEDAHHLLVGVSHSPGPGGQLHFDSWELVDISTMPVRLKAEFQSSNREIYRKEAIVGSGP